MHPIWKRCVDLRRTAANAAAAGILRSQSNAKAVPRVHPGNGFLCATEIYGIRPEGTVSSFLEFVDASKQNAPTAFRKYMQKNWNYR